MSEPALLTTMPGILPRVYEYARQRGLWGAWHMWLTERWMTGGGGLPPHPEVDICVRLLPLC